MRVFVKRYSILLLAVFSSGLAASAANADDCFEAYKFAENEGPDRCQKWSVDFDNNLYCRLDKFGKRIVTTKCDVVVKNNINGPYALTYDAAKDILRTDAECGVKVLNFANTVSKCNPSAAACADYSIDGTSIKAFCLDKNQKPRGSKIGCNNIFKNAMQQKYALVNNNGTLEIDKKTKC